VPVERQELDHLVVGVDHVEELDHLVGLEQQGVAALSAGQEGFDFHGFVCRTP